MQNDRYVSISESKSIRSLVIDCGKESEGIDLNPAYQRDVVWTEEKKKAFINSVHLGIVPTNVIFNLDSNTNVQVCIDGKQRITSLVEFCQNKFPLEIEDNDEQIYYNKVPEEATDGTDTNKCRTMTPQERQKFENTSISVVKYNDLTYDDQRNIFHRIQHGTVISQGELALSVFNTDSICKLFSEFSNKKMQSVNHFVKGKKDRKNHIALLMMLAYILEGPAYSTLPQSVPTVKNRNTFIEKYKTDTQMKTMIKSFEQKVNVLFSKELLNDPKLAKELMSATKPVFFSIFICYKFHKYDVTIMTKDQITELKNIIYNTLKYIKDNKGKIATTIKSIDQIFTNAIDTVSKTIEVDDDLEDIPYCENSTNGEPDKPLEEDEETITVPGKIEKPVKSTKTAKAAKPTKSTKTAKTAKPTIAKSKTE